MASLTNCALFYSNRTETTMQKQKEKTKQIVSELGLEHSTTPVSWSPGHLNVKTVSVMTSLTSSPNLNRFCTRINHEEFPDFDSVLFFIFFLFIKDFTVLFFSWRNTIPIRSNLLFCRYVEIANLFFA